MSDEKQVLLINWPIPTVKHGGGSIMGYFSVVDTGKLVKTNRRINAAKYIKVLEKKTCSRKHRTSDWSIGSLFSIMMLRVEDGSSQMLHI